MVAEGGSGGKGNINFATSTNQAPRIATKGKEGEEKIIDLTFSPKTDIILTGPPNSGKSSLISFLTGASPKIANYPFTTKKPHLWTYIHDFSRYIFMDTPPLIKESIEKIKILSRRAKIILIILDGSKPEKAVKAKMILKDIEEYAENNPAKKLAYVLAKADKVKEKPTIATAYPVFPVSIKEKTGIEELKKFLFKKN